MPKGRSPNYPSMKLSEALALAQKLWDKEQRTTVPPEVAVRAWNYNGLSGASRVALAGLRQYGLLDNASGGVRLSDLAIGILHSPKDSPERAAAIRKAALTPPLFQKMAKSHPNGSDDAIRSHLIIDRKFTEDGARRFIPPFREALKLANADPGGYTSLEPNGESEAMQRERPADQSLGGVGGIGPTATLYPPSVSASGPVHPYSWPLGKNIRAEVRIIGDGLQPSHLETLRKYLELAKDALASDDDPNGK